MHAGMMKGGDDDDDVDDLIAIVPAVPPETRYYARFPSFRNAVQRKSFYATESVACRTFFTQPQTPRRRLQLRSIRKQIETTSIFPQRRRRTRPITAAITFNQWLRRCGTLR